MLASRDDTVYIVVSAQSGNRESFASLVEMHEKEVYGYLVGLLGDRDEALDCVQKVFIKAWLNLASLKDPLCFKPWLYTIARNVVRDYWRSKKVLNQHQSWEQLEKSEVSSGILGPEERLIKAELVQLALAELPAKFRDCLLLRVVGGLPLTEIADIVDISEDSVRSYISSARKQFRKTYLDLENGKR